MVFSLRLYPYQRRTYFSDGPDLTCRAMRTTVFLQTSAVRLFERLRLLDGDAGTSEAEFACGRMRVWRWCEKGVGVVIAGA